MVFLPVSMIRIDIVHISRPVQLAGILSRYTSDGRAPGRVVCFEVARKAIERYRPVTLLHKSFVGIQFNFAMLYTYKRVHALQPGKMFLP